MNKAKRFALKVVRRILSGERDAAFEFKPSTRRAFPSFEGPQDFYVHIPYCRNKCAYCPYNTKPLDEAEVSAFYDTLLKEARQVVGAGATALGCSLYIGGGTPTCTGGALVRFIGDFVRYCSRPGTIAVETSADELDMANLAALKDACVTQLSVGVQSFDGRILKRLGRTGDVENYERTLALAAKAGFANLNVDLMYDADGETLEEINNDLSRAVHSGADQITIYPLFRFFRNDGVSMPSLRARRSAFAFIWQRMAQEGFSPVSVWSFRKGGRGEAFSSVQRRSFVGLGPGAATCHKVFFAFNTFDTSAWMRRIAEDACAYSLEMPLSPNIRALYSLYWDLYACRMPNELDAGLKRKGVFRALATAGRILGFVKGEVLTERGAYWTHLLQNQYMLDYINRVWSVSRNLPFPSGIRL